jgi:hypothetical protein
LFFAPVWTLSLFGWTTVDPTTTRLVGAALLGIGGESLLGMNAKPNTYRALLNLKIIWSIGAIISFILSIINGSPPISWFFLTIFSIFSITWIYYRITLGKEK